ncbi:MAG: serine/threonine protein kinase [Chloroflexi bacterium OLB15]|nr:MAG: serine/threonine protein kinase [Chloroflexi bacterium OLB15]
MLNKTNLIAGRYEIFEQIGSGGMGSIFRALDRLTRDYVALKRVVIWDDGADTTGGLVTLAQEFEALASLRHPNIISVLDYGFDHERQPFLALELLENAENIINAARDRSPQEKAELLSQALLALSYLHRRGILHRDLKPDNLLVADDRVRVLDFGLAVPVEFSVTTMAGTPTYMPPEVLRGEKPVPQSDLYSMGVLAFQIFTGRYPYHFDHPGGLVGSILNEAPDLSVPELDPEIVPVLERLLAKHPQERYADADEVIEAFASAKGWMLPRETHSTRESFLQAARFVGRREEIQKLNRALLNAAEGEGSAWLIGGESGVGKSRLLDELSTRALVRGALVLRGQGIDGGGLPYQLWREPIRRLLLATDVSEFEASVLREIVPDIGELLGYEVLPAPMLEGKPGQQRLISAVIELFRRQPQPIVLMLDDIQWASESITVLRELSHAVDRLNLLIVATYRDDEARHLPEKLPELQLLALERLTNEAISDLSQSILGNIGARRDVIDLLRHETEGNALFVVEVLRTLAEELGGMGQIGTATLPEHVFAGGVETVLKRRLDRIPSGAYQLLALSAVNGREIDLSLLTEIAPEADLDRWLTEASDAAVIEMRQNRYRFAHDKLREYVLRDMRADVRKTAHRQVAAGIEIVYEDHKERAAILFDHWLRGEVSEKALEYAEIAAQAALERSNYTEAIQIAQQGLVLAGDITKMRMDLLHVLAMAQMRAAQYEMARANFLDLLQIARAAPSAKAAMLALAGLSTVEWEQGDYSTGLSYAREAQQLMGNAAAELDFQLYARIYNALANLLWYTGEFDEAEGYYRLSLEYSRRAEHSAGIGLSLNNLALVAQERGDYAAALKLLEESLIYKLRVGNTRSTSITYGNIGLVQMRLGEYDAAEANYKHALELAQRIDDRISVANIIGELGAISEKRGYYIAALEYIEYSLVLSKAVNDRPRIVNMSMSLAYVHMALNQMPQAAKRICEGLQLAHEIGATPREVEIVVCAGRWLLISGEAEEAARFAAMAAAHPTMIKDVVNERLAPLQADLAQILGEQAMTVASVRGASLTLEQALGEVQARLCASLPQEPDHGF